MQADLSLHSVHLLEGIFSHVAVHISTDQCSPYIPQDLVYLQSLNQEVELIKMWINLMLFFLYSISICSAKSLAIQHLNMKLNRVNRITNGLQSDIEDIWTALSNIAMNNQNNFFNNTDQKQKPPNEVIQLLNDSIADVKNLKREVEQLVQYTRKGLRSEKTFSRDTTKHLTMSQNEFQTKITKEISDMKSWMQNFQEKQLQLQEDTLEQFQQQADVDNKKNQIIIQNLKQEYKNELDENKAETQACYDKLLSVEQKADDKISFIKDKINDKLSQAAACDKGWESFQSHCYFFGHDKKTWDEAKDFCQAQNSSMAEIEAENELQFVAKTSEAEYFWVGANDRAVEGQFIWYSSKQPVPQDYWYRGEPNNSEGDENCAELYTYPKYLGKLNDQQCYELRSYACEKNKFIF